MDDYVEIDPTKQTLHRVDYCCCCYVLLQGIRAMPFDAFRLIAIFGFLGSGSPATTTATKVYT